MYRRFVIAAVAMLALVTSGCSIIGGAVGNVVGGDNMTTVSQLWPDVPKMDGLTASQNDMPLPIKLVMRAVLGNLGLMNPQGQDRSTGNIDWIGFTTSHTSDEVKAFYSATRMAAQGWQAPEDNPCLSGNEAAQVGAFCVFKKQAGDQETYLAILAAQDDQAKLTNLFFLRLSGTSTPTPVRK